MPLVIFSMEPDALSKFLQFKYFLIFPFKPPCYSLVNTMFMFLFYAGASLVQCCFVQKLRGRSGQRADGSQTWQQVAHSTGRPSNDAQAVANAEQDILGQECNISDEQ